MRLYNLLTYITLAFVAVPGMLQAQSGEIKGTIYNRETGESLPAANIIILNTDIRVSSDVNGFFNITRLANKDYTLRVVKENYDTAFIDFRIENGGVVQRNIYMDRFIRVVEVTVEAGESEKRDRVEMSKVEVTPEKINIVPGVGGEPDLAQFLQVVPGVTFTGDQGGQFYIRGGAPIQNMTILDGMIIYNPFHSIGLFSVFDVDLIKNVDVYTGGFNARYGGRISGVMDVTTREGNQGRFSGKINVSPFSSKLTLEGPLKKFKEDEGGASFLVSGRTSYLEQSSKLFYPYAAGGVLPYNFTDIYGKTTMSSGNGSTFSLFGFNFRDNVNFPGSTHYMWNSYGAGGKAHFVPTLSRAVIDATFAYSRYETSQNENDGAERVSSIGGFQGRVDFSYFSNRDLLKYGIEINGFSTDFNFENAAKQRVGQNENTTELAAYIRYNKVLGNLVIDPSFRLHVYASLNEVSPEPRLGLKYNVTSRLRLKAAGGMFSQNLISAQSDQDVVNLFYGFLSGPDQLPVSADGSVVKSRLQKAQHAIAGVEIDLSKNISFEVEGYLKYFNQLTNVNRNKLFEDNIVNAGKPLLQKADFIRETGLAKGIDFQLTFDKKPAYFYLVYSLMQVTRNDGLIAYMPHWDRRHNINLVGAYKVGRKNPVELSARFAFGTGFPFSKTQGYYELIDFQNGIDTDIKTVNGQLAVLYSGVNNGRLSSYHRMDVSAKRNFQFDKHRSLSVILSCTNVYNRENVFYFNRLTNTRVNQLPVMPSVALNFSF